MMSVSLESEGMDKAIELKAFNSTQASHQINKVGGEGCFCGWLPVHISATTL